MSGRHVRLAIVSRDHVVASGLRQMLAAHTHRVVVVEDGGRGDDVDVVLHDDDVEPPSDGAVRRVPLSRGVEHLVALVEAAAAAGPHEPLSAREEQVMSLIAEGLTNQEIADRMFVSINSVKTYIRAAYRKVGVSTRSQAVVWGLQRTRDGG